MLNYTSKQIMPLVAFFCIVGLLLAVAIIAMTWTDPFTTDKILLYIVLSALPFAGLPFYLESKDRKEPDPIGL